jgi:hypothetical protein
MWGMPFLTAWQFRLFFPGGDHFDKNGNFECGTYHEVLDESLKTRQHLYIGLVVVY